MLRIDDTDQVRVCTLDRPEARNAFDDDHYDALRDALAGASASPDIAVVLLTATGPVFSAGQDMGEMLRKRTKEEYLARGFHPFGQTLQKFDKPLLAAVGGAGVGVGFTLLLHCDMVFVSEAARFRAPFVPLGITTEAGSSVLLPERVGSMTAARLLFTGDWFSAQEAAGCGFALGPFSQEVYQDEAMAMARRIAAMPVASLVATKQLLLAGRGTAVADAIAREDRVLGKLAGGPANVEAVRAFTEKRPPNFAGLPA